MCDAELATDGDQCTLRAAIGQANASSGADVIGFNIPESDPNHNPTTGVFTISPTSSGLPEITDAVTIDGYTQPGASPNTLAVGSDARLLIELSGSNLQSFWYGLDISASDSTVRGLVINRFLGHAVLVDECIFADGCSSSHVTNVRVEGNYIGTDASGTRTLVTEQVRQAGAGVVIETHNSIVGGTSPAARNVISGYRWGVSISQALFHGGLGNRVEGNYIGTDASGTRKIGNRIGVALAADDNIVGGASTGAGNTISGNNNYGVKVAGSASGNRVEGNYIGTEADSTSALANGVGVQIVRNITIWPSGFTLGGTTNGAANTIAFNRKDGVSIRGAINRGPFVANLIANSIFSNGDLGIDLADDGVTLNDRKDTDEGPNTLQNFPIITAAKPGMIEGRLNSTPYGRFLIQFFSNPTGTNEGQTFIGQTSVATNSTGNATFTFIPAEAVPPGRTITATATDRGGNTSEFSKPRTVTQP